MYADRDGGPQGSEEPTCLDRAMAKANDAIDTGRRLRIKGKAMVTTAQEGIQEVKDLAQGRLEDFLGALPWGVKMALSLFTARPSAKKTTQAEEREAGRDISQNEDE